MSNENQIIALLTGKAFNYACKELGVTSMANHSYSDVFTVTKKDVCDYVKEKGLPPAAPLNRAEGLCYEETEGSYHIYWLERGQKTSIDTITGKTEAEQKLVELLLNLSGTGIEFGGNRPSQPG